MLYQYFWRKRVNSFQYFIIAKTWVFYLESQQNSFLVLFYIATQACTTQLKMMIVPQVGVQRFILSLLERQNPSGKKLIAHRNQEINISGAGWTLLAHNNQFLPVIFVGLLAPSRVKSTYILISGSSLPVTSSSMTQALQVMNYDHSPRDPLTRSFRPKGDRASQNLARKLLLFLSALVVTMERENVILSCLLIREFINSSQTW